jgi:hypothetical protein
VAIGGYFINGFWCIFNWWLLSVILLMTFGAYLIGGYSWLFVAIILMVIDKYFISEYCCLLLAIGGYYINGY